MSSQLMTSVGQLRLVEPLGFIGLVGRESRLEDDTHPLGRTVRVAISSREILIGARQQGLRVKCRCSLTRVY